MRVRIQHGINTDELPAKVKELLSELIAMSEMHMKKLNAANALLYSVDNIGMVSAILDEARKSLIGIDQGIADVHSIAAGYAEYLNGDQSAQKPAQPAPASQQVEPAPSTQPPQPEQPASPQDMDDIITQMGQALQEKEG